MLSKLNPFIRFASVMNITNSKKKNSIGYDNRLFYCISGLANVIINDKAICLSLGTLVFIPSYTKYQLEVVENHSEVILVVLNFDLTDKNFMSVDSLKTHEFELWDGIKKNTEEIPDLFVKPLIISDLPDLEKNLTKITALFLQQPPYYREFSSAILKTILLRIITKTQVNDISALANDIINYVKAHYHENFTNQYLANYFNYHPYHLSRVIRKATGMSLKEFIIAYRIKVAKNLLASTNNNITEIAVDCGFPGSSYFSKTFRKIEGVSPKAYRKEFKKSYI